MLGPLSTCTRDCGVDGRGDVRVDVLPDGGVDGNLDTGVDGGLIIIGSCGVICCIRENGAGILENNVLGGVLCVGVQIGDDCLRYPTTPSCSLQ